MEPRRAPKEKAGQRPASPRCSEGTSGGLDVGRLLALRAVRDFERDLLAFLQRLETLTLDRGEMREQVLAAVVGLDEPEALCIVEPLDRTGSHDFYILETNE